MGDKPRCHRAFRSRALVDSSRSRPVTFLSPFSWQPPSPRRSALLLPPGPIPFAVPVRAAAPETPFFLRVHGLPVYAVFHEAVAGRPNAPVVVHVHGLGVEQI